jgi:hypothetical protein
VASSWEATLLAGQATHSDDDDVSRSRQAVAITSMHLRFRLALGWVSFGVQFVPMSECGNRPDFFSTADVLFVA